MPVGPHSIGVVAQPASGPEYAHTAHRYNSWSSAGRRAFLWTAVALTMTQCSYALAVGAWPIAVFAGLELGLLYGALAYVETHADDCELVTVDAGTLSLEIRNAGRTTVRKFNRYWVRVTYDDVAREVTLRSHAQELRLGRYVCPNDRKAWHAELVRALRQQSEAHRAT
ncbi:MAG TPA: DUF2244 domain-containing protein [Burkholderiales bacterium]|nr:DUF2244 domain-containing protein [Burkholderiales bacterium]